MKRFICIALIIILLLACVTLSACDEKLPKVNYASDNDHEFSKTQKHYSGNMNMVVYEPLDVSYAYGFIFYVGTLCSPDLYDYLASALARQGYLVVIPNNLFAVINYVEDEPIFSYYPNVKFFIGGHSQGGGAAVRRAEQNQSITQGVVLLSPLLFNSTTTDEYGDPAVHEDSLKGTSIPTLFLEAEFDRILTDDMKATSRNRVDPEHTIHITMSNAEHMGFVGSHDFDSSGVTDEDIAAQQAATVQYVLSFLKEVVTGI